jgi:hypothetical protein
MFLARQTEICSAPPAASVVLPDAGVLHEVPLTGLS